MKDKNNCILNKDFFNKRRKETNNKKALKDITPIKWDTKKHTTKKQIEVFSSKEKNII